MNRREFLMSTLAAFTLAALPKLTIAETIAVSDEVKKQITDSNKLGFGFMRLPLKDPNDQTSIDYNLLNTMVDKFMERGFTYFDTAWMYMGYESEIAIRKSVVERYPRHRYTVASKMPIIILTPTRCQMLKNMIHSNLLPIKRRKEKLNISAFHSTIMPNFWKKF